MTTSLFQLNPTDNSKILLYEQNFQNVSTYRKPIYRWIFTSTHKKRMKVQFYDIVPQFAMVFRQIHNLSFTCPWTKVGVNLLRSQSIVAKERKVPSIRYKSKSHFSAFLASLRVIFNFLSVIYFKISFSHQNHEIYQRIQ